MLSVQYPEIKYHVRSRTSLANSSLRTCSSRLGGGGAADCGLRTCSSRLGGGGSVEAQGAGMGRGTTKRES